MILNSTGPEDPHRSELWAAGRWLVDGCSPSWLCSVCGREGHRESIPHAVNNSDQCAPQPLSRNLFIMLCIFITMLSIALVQTRLQSACQRLLLKHQSSGRQNQSLTLNILLTNKTPCGSPPAGLSPEEKTCFLLAALPLPKFASVWVEQPQPLGNALPSGCLPATAAHADANCSCHI